jgi:hypothetical protein
VLCLDHCVVDGAPETATTAIIAPIIALSFTQFRTL